MSVLVKGMEMPIACIYCDLIDSLRICPAYKMTFDDFWADKSLRKQRHPDCPLIPVPPHSRLIDADVLKEFVENRFDITWHDDYEGGIKDACVDILKEIEKMPTVIGAEGEET